MMKPLRRMLFVLVGVCASLITLGLTVHASKAPVGEPLPTASPSISPPRASQDVSPTLGLSPTIYLPLVAQTVISSEQPVTFTLPPDLFAIATHYPLTDVAYTRLRTQGFVILAGASEDRLSEAYRAIAGDSDLPVFVTSDAMLYLFHAVIDDLLKTVEQDALYTETLTLVQALQAGSADLYAAVPSTQTLGQAAARHNLIVFSVARKLLEPDIAPPASVLTDVLTYTRKITEHTVTELYPGDDYTQYEPRGHYAGDPQLERYFRALKWLGRRIYRIEDHVYPHDADVELVAAVQLAQMLQENTTARTAWERLYEVTRRLCGPADSITPPLVSTAVSRTFGVSFTLTLLEDPDNLTLLRTELLTEDIYPTSEIIPVPTLPGQMPSKYVQVLGERYLPDAEIMQETTFPYTARTLPSGLDVMAVLLASEEADTLLAEEKAHYPNLGPQLAALRTQFKGCTTMPQENLPTIVLQDQGNDRYSATYTGFDDLGSYRVVIHAEDNDGREGRPLSIEVRTGWEVYLPLVVRD